MPITRPSSQKCEVFTLSMIITFIFAPQTPVFLLEARVRDLTGLCHLELYFFNIRTAVEASSLICRAKFRHTGNDVLQQNLILKQPNPSSYCWNLSSGEPSPRHNVKRRRQSKPAAQQNSTTAFKPRPSSPRSLLERITEHASDNQSSKEVSDLNRRNQPQSELDANSGKGLLRRLD
ncbi:hypothetical protein KEM48_007782 [Puccinia striiformis f. sp. tritici PST-130]|uniref:Uncharacterized protein n=1 Tax=Puccinia striiformis f. sp. tritici PST-78 TaxID=1165861 RepID=A0A0L0V1C6_9BASI|nr:hypothetical protein KEM48_007782 [Puccinia striiformis f. sp. tritici PST-130]KNE92981.1 hypothetical protein PSTG_13618 [Puccinia striiformis f. sp. tritici PST-78]